MISIQLHTHRINHVMIPRFLFYIPVYNIIRISIDILGWWPPDHGPCRMIWWWLVLPLRLVEVFTIRPPWHVKVVPKDAPSLELGYEEFDDIHKSLWHNSVGLKYC